MQHRATCLESVAVVGPFQPAAIKAFRLLKQRLSGIRLLVFGGSWDKAKKQCAADKQIVFTGGLPHREFLRFLAEEIDVWVHPSKIETQGIAFLEATLAGCPVVAGTRERSSPLGTRLRSIWPSG